MPAPEDRGGRRPARDSLRVLAGPLVAYFDKRFQDVYDRIDDRMNELYGRVATEVETMSEITLVMQRFVDVSGDRVDDMIEEMRRLSASLGDREVAASLGDRDVTSLESAFALVCVGRLRPGARILYVASGRADTELPGALRDLGYEVTSQDAPDADTPYDCAVWLPGVPDRHEVDLLRKSLGDQGELVMCLPHAGDPETFVDDVLGGWSVRERRLVSRGGATVELVRAAPPP
jgi:hypothetical protein